MKKVFKAYVSEDTRKRLMELRGEPVQLWVYVGLAEHLEPGDKLMTVKVEG